MNLLYSYFFLHTVYFTQAGLWFLGLYIYHTGVKGTRVPLKPESALHWLTRSNRQTPCCMYSWLSTYTSYKQEQWFHRTTIHTTPAFTLIVLPFTWQNCKNIKYPSLHDWWTLGIFQVASIFKRPRSIRRDHSSRNGYFMFLAVLPGKTIDMIFNTSNMFLHWA